MKKLFWGMGILILLGAGCAESQPADNANNPNNGNAPWNANANGNSGNDNVPPGDVALEELPEVKPPKKPIDESAWSKATTKSGITIVYPTKGGFAPTWTYQVLSKDDERLDGNCYVTPDTVYKKTDFSGFTDACQTATAFNPGPASRTDYFVFNKGGYVNLVTISKNYPANFDMEEYGATVDHFIKAIK